MQTVMLKVKSESSEKLLSLLSQFKNEVEIVKPKDKSKDWKKIYSHISTWDINEENIKMKSWQVEKY